MFKLIRLTLAAIGLYTVAAPAEPSPLLGRWELDLTRLPADYGVSPRRVVYAFEQQDSGYWLTHIDITGQDGRERHIALRYLRDGKAVRGSGDASEGDVAAVSAPADDILVMSIAADKHLGSVRVYSVTGDGREMIESAANVDRAGAPFVRRFHFKRID